MNNLAHHVSKITLRAILSLALVGIGAVYLRYGTVRPCEMLRQEFKWATVLTTDVGILTGPILNTAADTLIDRIEAQGMGTCVRSYLKIIEDHHL